MNHRINRRQFQAIAASSTLAFSAAANAQPAPQPAPQMAFLSDTHIDADTNTVARGIRMAEHLEQVVGQVVDALPSGSHVIVNGDCAYLKGLPGDYATFAKLIAPLNNAGLQLHVTMVNLPAVAYVFDSKQPSGWVRGTFSDSELRLRINTLDRSHPNSDEELRVSLKV